MRIKVTQEDIDGGVPQDVRACPIARAMKRQTGKASKVGMWSAWTVEEDWQAGIETEYVLPPAAREFIRAFDYNRAPVQPATFNLRKAKHPVNWGT